MANRIRPLRRTGSSGVPVVANMLDGEIAVNSFDKKIYMRVGANLVEIANASSGDWNTLANKPAYANAWGSINPTSKLDYRANLDANGAATHTDWNTATTQGWWMASGAANAPPGFTASGEWLIGQVTVHNPSWVQQEVWPFTRGPEAKRFRRDLSNGVWGAWTDAVSHGRVHAVPGEYGSANSAFFSNGPYATQQGALAIMWNDARIWQIGAENNGDFKIWAYSDTGVYVGNPITISGAGLLTLAGTMRATGELKQGSADSGWGMTWNVVAAGVGASEYTNNRQGGSGGHLFSTRQNDTQTPQQHHHMLSDGRMNVRTAAGGWATQPRLFSGGGDPGGNASPGDLWFLPV